MDDITAIETSEAGKQASPAGKLGVVGGAVEALIGIYSVFEAAKKIINPPEKQRQTIAS